MALGWGKALETGLSLVDQLWTSEEEKMEKKQKLFELAQKGELQKVMAGAKVVTAEAKSEHWITSAWRPLTMLVIAAIMANNYILYPYLSLFWDQAPSLELPDQMWNLMQIGLGGYVVGRSGEKMIDKWKKNNTMTEE